MIPQRFSRGTICAAAMLLCAGCGALQERAAIQQATAQQSDIVRDQIMRQRNEDAQHAAAVREIPGGVWLGARTIKVSRDAELPPVFSRTMRFSFPDRPTLVTLGDRISKIIGIAVRVSPDAIVPLEAFAAQRVGNMTAGMTANGLGTTMSTPAAAGQGLPGAPASMSSAAGLPAPLAPAQAGLGGMYAMQQQATRGFILDQLGSIGGSLTPIELLDQVSAKFGVGWDYKDGSILISRLVTRTYQIATIPDINTLTSSISKTASAGESGGSSTGTGSQAGSAASSSTVSARLTSQIDIVQGLKAAIESTLTPNIGKYAVSSSGVVTVTDTREVQEQIRELIAAENRTIGRQVRLRMQIVEVTASNGTDLGIDWSWAIKNAASRWNVDFYAPGQTSATGLGQLGVIRQGDHSTSQVFLQALATVGKIHVRKDETYTILNNRPLSVASTESFIYPARSSAAASTTQSTTVIPGVEPGQLTTGTFLNMRTSIQPNGSVIVQFSLDASNRGETKTFVSNGATLQYPQTSANQYQIYTSIVNGDTAVLAGIDNTQQTSNDRSLDRTLSPLLGGSISTSGSRRAVLVMLTPQIIEGVH